MFKRENHLSMLLINHIEKGRHGEEKQKKADMERRNNQTITKQGSTQVVILKVMSKQTKLVHLQLYHLTDTDSTQCCASLAKETNVSTEKKNKQVNNQINIYLYLFGNGILPSPQQLF